MLAQHLTMLELVEVAERRQTSKKEGHLAAT